MQIKINSIDIENFKGIKELHVDFGNNTEISGQNAAGKSSIFDAVTWLLWNKDSSGSEKFNIRPVDADGENIHYIDISVSASFEFDGVAYVLKKVQKEKWVKKRGSENQEFQGNVNEFEINGYPKSQKDYSTFINSIVSEDKFKLISNPMAFTSLPWKEQRKILFSLVSETTDYEIAQTDSRFIDLLEEFRVASVDDIRAKYAKTMNGLKKDQVELPARIDEVSKQIVDIDLSDLELKRNSLKEKISTLNEKILISDVDEIVKVKQDEIFEKKMELSKVTSIAFSELDNRRRNADREINSLTNRKNEILLDKRLHENKKSEAENRLKYMEEELKELGISYHSVVDSNFDEKSAICPTCGRSYDESKVNEIKAKFEKNKSEKARGFIEKGNAVKKSILEAKEIISKVFDESELNEVNAKLESAIAIKNEIPDSVNLSENVAYNELKNSIDNLEKEIEEAKKQDNCELKYELKLLQEELHQVELEIAKSDCSAAEQRKEDLENELVEIGQRIADCEKILYLLELFVTEKLNRISNQINSKFSMVNFKLFNKQINGGIAECCEVTVIGVPFASVNTGHKIVAGLDIIQTLQNITNISSFVFIDNAEAINDFNIPKMDNQLICLRVSGSKELEVKVND